MQSLSDGPVAIRSDQSAYLESEPVHQHVLKVIHGKTYIFQANTNEINPGAAFDWSRTDDVNTAGGSVIKYGVVPPQNGCSIEEDIDTLTIANLDYDTWWHKKLRVDATIDFRLESAWEHVVLDVEGNCNSIGKMLGMLNHNKIF